MYWIILTWANKNKSYFQKRLKAAFKQWSNTQYVCILKACAWKRVQFVGRVFLFCFSRSSFSNSRINTFLCPSIANGHITTTAIDSNQLRPFTVAFCETSYGYNGNRHRRTNEWILSRLRSFVRRNHCLCQQIPLQVWSMGRTVCIQQSRHFRGA